MAPFVKFGTTLLAGTALGLGLTLLLINRQPVFGSVESGPWWAWPTSGTADADPYALASFAHDGRIALAGATGLMFLARTDSAGDRLRASCSYEVSGPTPQAQYWTVTVLTPSGQAETGPSLRSGFTSAEIVRATDGSFTIALSPQARTGNWLPLPRAGAFELMLSFYDTPLTTSLQTGGAVPTLPAILKRTCR